MIPKVNENNRIDIKEAITAVVEIESMMEVRCPLPLRQTRQIAGDRSTDEYIASGYYVSVSNDGVTYSDEDVLIVLDPTCVNCSVDGSTTTCVVQVCSV